MSSTFIRTLAVPSTQTLSNISTGNSILPLDSQSCNRCLIANNYRDNANCLKLPKPLNLPLSGLSEYQKGIRRQKWRNPLLSCQRHLDLADGTPAGGQSGSENPENFMLIILKNRCRCAVIPLFSPFKPISIAHMLMQHLSILVVSPKFVLVASQLLALGCDVGYGFRPFATHPT